MASIGSLDELLRPTLSEVVEQWESIHRREPYEQGRRQADFTAAEIIMSHGASLLVDHRRYGSTTAHSAEEPVLLLASLFRRPPTSVLAKMANSTEVDPMVPASTTPPGSPGRQTPIDSTVLMQQCSWRRGERASVRPSSLTSSILAGRHDVVLRSPLRSTAPPMNHPASI